MELHKNLIDIIDADLHTALEQLYSKEDSLHAKIISDLLKNPEITPQQIKKRYEISEGTLNKTLTLVKDHLWGFNARHITTTFDDIFVLRQMLLHGKIKNALKFYTALKKNFTTTQQWDKLDCLYIEGLRYAQITGDENMAMATSAERKENSFRLHEYTLLYCEIIPEMIRLESYKVKKFDPSYAYYIEDLYARAQKCAHHLLIHNTLHIKYLLYSRFKNTPENVFSIVNAIKANAEKHKAAMAPITYAMSINTYVNFLTIYRHFGSPEVYTKQLHKVIHHGGKMAQVNFYYSMLEYALFEKKPALVNYWLHELTGIKDDSKFSQCFYTIAALQAYIEKDIPGFQSNFAKFYHDPSHLNFPDHEITLRIIDIIISIEKEQGDHSNAKLQALRVFMGRNLDKERYHDERKLISLLTKINEGKKEIKAEVEELEQSAYRNIFFLISCIKESLLK